MLKSEAFGGFPDALQIHSEWGDRLHDRNCTQVGYDLSNHLYPPPVLELLLAWAHSRQMVISLKDAREQARLSQEGLAHLVSSGRSTIVKLENGKLPLNQKWAVRLAPHLGLEAEQLWAGPPLPSAAELENMIELAMQELPVGSTHADYARVVASSLRTQLEHYQAAGGSKPSRGLTSVPGTGSQLRDPKTESAPA
jgi:DNA-binding XRE family transcriptional regulator